MLQLRSTALLITAVFLSATAFAGTKYAVGTCQPKLTFYNTIQEAVSSVPSGSTIEVCPGTYFEQVYITQPLTLEGVASGSGDQAVVALPLPPNAVISVNDPNFGFVCYQIHVQSTGPVNISNLAVDGGPLS